MPVTYSELVGKQKGGKKVISVFYKVKGRFPILVCEEEIEVNRSSDSFLLGFILGLNRANLIKRLEIPQCEYSSENFITEEFVL